jgi:hypothetical protein
VKDTSRKLDTAPQPKKKEEAKKLNENINFGENKQTNKQNTFIDFFIVLNSFLGSVWLLGPGTVQH